MNSSSDEIIKQFDLQVGLFEDFRRRVYDLIVDVLRENEIEVHSVTSRVKNRESLQRKMSGSTNGYRNLSDITDVMGLRITTHFSDDVDRVANVIQQEFSVDSSNSVDKRKELDSDRFGYLSLHHIVSLPENRCRLTEYKKFENLKFEIQTRSILQHAWAEIEHDLGYKSPLSVPREVRRRFSRLAGLLELADQEFVEIRKQLTIYEGEVGEKIKSSPQKVEINNASVEELINQSKLITELDDAVALLDNGSVDRETLYNFERWEDIVHGLNLCDIRYISELETSLGENGDSVLQFAKKWLENDMKGRSFAQGISLLYLVYFVLGKTQDKSKVRKFIDVSRLIQEGHESLDDKIFRTYNLITG